MIRIYTNLTVLLNLVFNCCNNLFSSSVNKVTTGTYNFVSVILEVTFVELLTTATAELPT